MRKLITRGAAALLLVCSVGYSSVTVAEIYVATHGSAVNDADEYLVSLLSDRVIRRPNWVAPHVSLRDFMALAPADRHELIQRSSNRALNVKVEGAITMEDAELFEALSELIAAQEGRIISIGLNSPGGSVFAALTIAQTIRGDAHFFAKHPPTWTHVYDGTCYSACVIVFAAGFYRDASTHGPYNAPLTSLGIHRPSFSPAEIAAAGYNDISAAYAGLRQRLQSFFESIHVNAQLVDDMYLVPSNDLRILTEAEANAYGLLGADLVVKERSTALSKLYCEATYEKLKQACDVSLIAYCREVTGPGVVGKCETWPKHVLRARRVSVYDAEQALPSCSVMHDCADAIHKNW